MPEEGCSTPLSSFVKTYDRLSLRLRMLDTMELSALLGRVLSSQAGWNKSVKTKLSTSDSGFEWLNPSGVDDGIKVGPAKLSTSDSGLRATGCGIKTLLLKLSTSDSRVCWDPPDTQKLHRPTRAAPEAETA